MKLKHLVLSALAAVGLAFTSQAEVYKPTGNSWKIETTYAGTTGTLTENVADGQTPWILKVSKTAKKSSSRLRR